MAGTGLRVGEVPGVVVNNLRGCVHFSSGVICWGLPLCVVL